MNKNYWQNLCTKYVNKSCQQNLRTKVVNQMCAKKTWEQSEQKLGKVELLKEGRARNMVRLHLFENACECFYMCLNIPLEYL